MGKKRKTRQEKIIADLRRKLDMTQGTKREMTRLPTSRGEPDGQGNEKSFDSELGTDELQEDEVRSEKKETEKSNLPFPSPASHLPSLTSISLIKKDLTKTAALAALAISLEVVLFFLLG